MNEAMQLEGSDLKVTVGDAEYSGSHLAMVIAMNPNLAAVEAARTPQLIFELGRIVALAYREKAEAEASYRAWRDSTVHRLTNDLADAKSAGFACAVDPGTDAKGKPKPPKLPSTTAAEAYMRTLPPYLEHQATIAQREEAWSTLHAALDAAKARTWAVRVIDRENGGSFSDDNQTPKRVVADFSGPDTIEPAEVRSPRPPPPPPRRSRR